MRLINAELMKTLICEITNEAIDKNQHKATIQKRLILAVEKMEGYYIPDDIAEELKTKSYATPRHGHILKYMIKYPYGVG